MENDTPPSFDSKHVAPDEEMWISWKLASGKNGTVRGDCRSCRMLWETLVSLDRDLFFIETWDRDTRVIQHWCRAGQ